MGRWFQLIDAKTRGAFARTSADVLSVPEGTTVARFRNLVFDKIVRALPPHVLAGNVRVYADRETYDKEGGQPLDPRSLLDGLGELKELIVEVRSAMLLADMKQNWKYRISTIRAYRFQVVDARTRGAFAQTSAGELYLPEGTPMVHFRNLVFDKIAQELPLYVLDGNLRVYPDRETYDKEGGQPLGPRSLLDDLGKLKELIVEVPTATPLAEIIQNQKNKITTTRTVWFQLVDEGTRDAFARTSVDELLLPEGAIMAQFQNRVFGKIARALPPDWGSFILRVYPDRETYDEEGGQPLDPYSLLDGLGELKELIVEVPPRDIDIVEMELKYLFLETLEWREPRRFCESAGRDWIYQGEQELTAVLSRELVKNYEAWNQCRGDNQKVFLVGSGPGTGKSRMLDEMKNLVCQSAKLSENEALIDRMKEIYVFNVTFENDTAATGSLVKRDIPEFDISYRMLYQLVKEGKKTPWATFVRKVKKLYSRLPFTIERVIAILAQLKKVDDMQKMTVILCVDGLERLENDGSKECDFYRVLSSICSFLNSSKAFSICVCSASMQYEALADSTMKHKYLIPPSLDGNRIGVPWTRSARQVLDDIGGHGRALEVLWEVMDRPNITEMIRPDYIVKQVLDGLKMRYGSIFNSGTFADPKTCKELVAAVISRRRYHLTDTIGQSPFTVKTLRRLGFFYWTDERRLECAFIFIVLMVRNIPMELGEIESFDYLLMDTRLTWKQFDHFVAFIRSLKSIAYCGTQVALSEFHTGARFGSVDGIDTIEPHSRTVVENLRKVEAKPDTYFTNRRGYVDISKMKTIHINERKGFAGDIVTRVELIEKGSYRCDEVIQCKLFSTTRKVDKETYLKEREDAVSTDSDVFLFITSAEVADFDLPPRCGVISIEEFEQYFGSLTSRAYRSLLERLDIDNASHAKLCQVDGVGVVTPQEIIDKKQRVKAKKEQKQAAEDVEATVTQEDQSNADEAEEAKRPMKKQKQEPKSKKNKKQGGKAKKPNGKN